MSLQAKLAAMGRTLFRKRRLEADLDEEVRAYVDELTERNVRAGQDRAAARRAAVMETGGIEQVKEHVRDARVGRRFDAVVQDIRYAGRGLRRAPLFTAVVVATLALGIGANTAIFSVIDAVLLRPVPVPDLDRLVMLWETDRQTGTTREPASIPDYLDFRARARSVERLGALVAGEVNLAPRAGDPVRLAALQLTSDLLPMLGVRPLAGRPFTSEEDRAGGPRVVLISESLWQRALGRDPDIVGKSVRLDEVLYTVVGVVPDAADFGVLQILSAAAYSRAFADRGDRLRVDVWLPLQPDPTTSPRDTHPIFVLGRMRARADRASVQREFDGIARDLERTYPVNAARGVHVEPLAGVVFGPVRPALLLLLVAVALVLLVACVNVANLLLARGTTRAREIAIRTALGAAGRRLALQFLIESLILACIACAGGVLLAQLALTMLVAAAPPGIPRIDTVTMMDWRVLGVALAVSVGVGTAFGLLPTLQARRLDLQAALKADAGRRGASSIEGRRVRRALVVAELSLAVMLLAGAALLIRSLWNVQHVDAGFRADGVLKAEYQLPAARYPVDFKRWPNFTEMHAFNEGLIRRAAAIPGVESVAVAGNHPLDAGFTNSFVIVGREAESRSFPEISLRRVTPGYFRTVGLHLVRGRFLDEGDRTNAAPVVVINQAAARRFFPNTDPLGARIRFWGAMRTIVGTVADERFHGLVAPPPIALYAPLAQAPSANGAGVLLVRTAGDPTALVSAVRKAFRDQDAQLAVFGVEPLSRTVAQSLAERRFVVVLLALFAAAALTLAAIGVHGVMAYGVAQRTREFGIRMALGAEPRQVWSPVLREAFVLTALGLVIGVTGALAMTRFLAAYLFGVAAADPLTFGGVAGILGVVAVIGGGIPARRATKVDPVIALRSE